MYVNCCIQFYLTGILNLSVMIRRNKDVNPDNIVEKMLNLHV